MKKILLTLTMLLTMIVGNMRSQNVVEIIVNSPDHDTLEAAIIAAGLADDLSAPGPFTVFAPTDAAFAALPAGTIESLLADPTGLLAQILLYHVVGAQALSTDLVSDTFIPTLNGDSVYVNINDNGVFIDNAQVTVANILGSNGVVHVINAAILPGSGAFIDGCTDMNACNYDSNATLDNGACFSNGDVCDDQDAGTINDMYIDCACVGEIDLPNTVVDIIVNSADHDTLEAAVIAAGLADDLSGAGPFTVFAPTDAAFAALPAGTIDALLADPTFALAQILLYHVVGAQALSTDLISDIYVSTLNGDSVYVNINANGVFIDNAQVTVADLLADNGVVHVIDAVLLPDTNVVEYIDGCTNMNACNYDSNATLDNGACFSNGDVCDDQDATTINDMYIDCACMGEIDLPNTVVDIIINSADHDTLEAAVIAAGLADDLSGAGPFTVFAPTDAAFAALPAGTIDALLADPTSALAQILLYHVVGAQALSTDLVSDVYITTLNGDSVYVNLNANGVFINSAQVTVADLLADNGVVHVIDAVLLPDTNIVEYIDGCTNLNACNYDSTASLDNGTCFSNGDVCDDQDAGTINDMYIDCACVGEIDLPNTVVEIIVNSADHDTLEAAVIAAGLADDLSGAGPFTVFAPTDAAFAALPAGTIDALLADPTGALAQILLYHVVGSQALSTDLSNGMTITTLEGSDVTVTIDSNGVFINNAQVIVADLLADNGVVHVIDAVLLPQVDPVNGCTDMNACNYDPTANVDNGTCFSNGDVCDDQDAATINDMVVDCACVGEIDLPNTVVDIIVNSADHDTLEAAVIAAGLADDLSGAGPFTVFAPTDAAFAALPAGVIDALLADPTGLLTDILLYHVIGSQALSTDLSNGMTITTLEGSDVTVTIDANGVFINNAQVIVADLLADNGVVHVIDAVLLPPVDPVNGCTDMMACNYDSTATIDDSTCFFIGDVCDDGIDTTENDVVMMDCSCVGTPIATTTVWDIIQNSPDHTTLELAIVTAGLDGTLSGDGPFTVFAPTDAAFSQVDPLLITALLADLPALNAALLYHVTGTEYLSTDLSDMMEIPMLSGDTAMITINANGVFIDSAQITVVDLVASNGVVHVIDAVILPTMVVENQSIEFNIYPNPVKDAFRINSSEYFNNQQLSISDATGRLVSSVILSGYSNVVNVSSLPAGMYTVTLTQGGAHGVSRFVKN